MIESRYQHIRISKGCSFSIVGKVAVVFVTTEWIEFHCHWHDTPQHSTAVGSIQALYNKWKDMVTFSQKNCVCLQNNPIEKKNVCEGEELKWRMVSAGTEKKKGESIRQKEWECCLCWLPASTAVPCVCVGCALNPRQLINPALLHTPQGLSTVSATLHNHPAQGWEEQAGPVSRATLALGTRPPYTSLQLCLGLDMPHRDEKLALSTFLPSLPHSWLII